MTFKAWPAVSLLAAFTAAFVPACGGGGGSRSPAGPAPPAPTPEPIAFGPGEHRVNVTIQPGRYFANPTSSGCYWERLRGFGGTVADIISNDSVGFDSPQVIVDILASDLAFGSDDCGNWYTTPRQSMQIINIQAGTWLVGSQVAPGTYQAAAGPGCYWERNRNFEGGVGSIIASDSILGAGSIFVEIRDGDVGFLTNEDCGTWMRATGMVGARTQSASEIARVRQQARARRGLS